MAASDNKTALADVLSALAMTRTINGKREVLSFKLQGHRTQLADWGHEYVRSLAGDIGQEFSDRSVAEPPKPCDDLIALVDVIVPFHFKHNAEPEAIDLLMEVRCARAAASCACARRRLVTGCVALVSSDGARRHAARVGAGEQGEPRGRVPVHAAVCGLRGG